ncbi:G1-specific transcriptional repressor WHI5 [Cyberlindnera fabianii]|uniref:G1-specific transcriptional repressor WHI5 n=1 Tax=Cyberlindnera fabianii TaxID=36022 RepID=A0A1V2LFL1_CYBFA|nr:G1-specific transcriptional repressor WHI5 [Cyberlindnera fabianii]
MANTSTEPQVQSQDLSTASITPSTPDGHRRSSSNSNNPITPPHNTDAAQISHGTYRSPDAYTHTNVVLPPMTPSTHTGHQSQIKLGNVPETPLPNGALEGAGDTSPSPLKSPSQAIDDDEEKPPIRNITSKLRTRLNYAFVKYSNGWANQSLDELEKSVDNEERGAIETKFGSPSPQRAQLASSPFNKNGSPSKVQKPSYHIKSPVRLQRRSIDPSDTSGSAHAAFRSAISKSKTLRSPGRSVKSPLRPPPLQLNTTPSSTTPSSSQSAARSPEADAIATLMSLKSPQAFRPNVELSRSNLPRQKLTFGEKGDSAIETESDTEYEGSDNESTGGSPSRQRAERMQVDDDVETASEHED